MKKQVLLAPDVDKSEAPVRESRITPDVADVAMDNSTHSGNRLANCAESLFQIMAAQLFHPGADPADSVHLFRVFQPPEFTHPAVRVFLRTCVGSAQPDCLRVYRTADARRVRRETVLNKAKRSLRGTSGDRDLILRLDVKSFFGFGIGGQR